MNYKLILLMIAIVGVISSLGGIMGKSMAQNNQTSATISIAGNGTDIVGSNNTQFNSTNISDDKNKE